MVLQIAVQALVVTASCFLLSYLIRQHAEKTRAKYPPGPQPKPIIGNAFDIPFKKPWIQYAEWSRRYNSDILHLCALSTHVVILNNVEDAAELLERRSVNYSSRPSSPVISFLGMEFVTILLPYGSTFRKQRRFLDDVLKKDMMPPYRHVQVNNVHLLLNQLLRYPSEFVQHCNMLSTSVTIASVYGYDIIPGQKKDRYVELAEVVSRAGSDLLLPGSTLITVFPFLRYIPPWMPGASTQRRGAQVREAAILYKNEPFEYVKRNMASGTARDSMLKRLLERSTETIESSDEEGIKDAISSLYLAAVETMQIVLVVFILAMTLHPLEQKKAQEEIDQVVGPDRLPTFEDRASLPYVEALYREVLRWRPVVPLSLAHATLQDDMYKGYYIPKGSVILPNVWAITRNQETYPEPESFRPERFFDADGSLKPDTVLYAFGFGRRICPGRHMADLVVWLSIVSILATFSISKAKDEEGAEIDIDGNAFTDTLTTHPLPFKCSIIPRSPQVKTLIGEAASAALQELEGW